MIYGGFAIENSICSDHLVLERFKFPLAVYIPSSLNTVITSSPSATSTYPQLIQESIRRLVSQ